MKKFIIILIAVLIAGVAEAQLLQFGLKGGVSSSKAQVDERFNVDGTNVTYTTGDAVLGWHIGLYSRVKISKFYVQPELLFSSTGGEILVNEEGVTTPEIGEVKLQKLDIPIMAGFQIVGPLRIFVGPAFSIILSDEFDVSNLPVTLEQNYNSATIGYQAGVGVDISRLTVDLKYEGNLSKLGESVTIPGTNEEFSTDVRNPQFILSAGFRF